MLTEVYKTCSGPTRKEARLSEAQSYYNLTIANAYFNLVPHNLRNRVLVEERALDSYCNILFSIVQFWRMHDYIWPTSLTIISHGFKRERLMDKHCRAIGFPFLNVNFEGIDPPFHLGLGNPGTIKGNQIALQHWTDDPHGEGEVLASKRKKRNPWMINQDLFISKDEREKGGIATRKARDGTEILDADSSHRPWTESTCLN